MTDRAFAAARGTERRKMVDEIVALAAGISRDGAPYRIDKRVLEAMRRVPREAFVPEELRSLAYRNRPLAIGHGQTISQPLIVALMTDLIQPAADHIVLDIGTGSGYQAAVLARLVAHVYSLEIVPELAQAAAQAFARLGIANISSRTGDGYAGWPEHAPYDAILVAAAPDHVPPALIAQLKPGGRLVIPVGEANQELLLIEKRADGTTQQTEVIPVRFVPLTRED